MDRRLLYQGSHSSVVTELALSFRWWSVPLPTMPQRLCQVWELTGRLLHAKIKNYLLLSWGFLSVIIWFRLSMSDLFYYILNEGRTILTASMYTVHVAHRRTNSTNRWSVTICWPNLIGSKLVWFSIFTSVKASHPVEDLSFHREHSLSVLYGIFENFKAWL